MWVSCLLVVFYDNIFELNIYFMLLYEFLFIFLIFEM